MMAFKFMIGIVAMFGIIGLKQVSISATKWPVTPQFYPSRGTPDPYCEGHHIFCLKSIPVPTFKEDDILEVFAMKKPVYQYSTGDLLGKFGIWHEGIGFKSKQTGMNFTVEWYEMFDFVKSTFPTIKEGVDHPIWCNEGAACLYDGINDRQWEDNGTITKVTELSGSQFSDWGEWLLMDNETGPYYQTWRVLEGDQEGDKQWFEPFDCVSFVLRSFKKMKQLGAEFDRNIKLNHTFGTLYSAQPVFLGAVDEIFGPKAYNETLAKTLMTWYTSSQPYRKDVWGWVCSVIAIIVDLEVRQEFYLFYNKAYWFLPLKDPVIRICYEYVPLP